MKFATATATNHEIRPLTQQVYGFVEAQGKIIASGVTSPSDCEPVADYIDSAVFKRVSAYLEELQNSLRLRLEANNHGLAAR